MTHRTAAIVAALNSKGGVGKSTLIGNIGGLCADIGLRTLLVDAAPQPSLTKYFRLAHEAPQGIVELVTQGAITTECISRTEIPKLHLVRSNDGEARLQHWLYGKPDARLRLARALRNQFVNDSFDLVLIDTQGAIGPLQTAAAFAADTLLSPLPPDTPSIREFRSGTLKVLHRLESGGEEPSVKLAPIQAVICKYDHSRDARSLLAELRAEFEAGDRVSIFDTMIPNAVAYRDAFTARRPVHQTHRTGGARNASGYEVMHRLVWELFPNLYGYFAGGLQGDPATVFKGSSLEKSAA